MSMESTDVKKRQRLLLEFLREQTCNHKGFPVMLKSREGKEYTFDCFDIFLSSPCDGFQNDEARKLYTAIQEDYNIADLNTEVLSNTRGKPVYTIKGTRPTWLALIHEDMAKLMRDGYISYESFGLHCLASVSLRSAYRLFRSIQVEEKGEERLEAPKQNYPRRFVFENVRQIVIGVVIVLAATGILLLLATRFSSETPQPTSLTPSTQPAQ